MLRRSGALDGRPERRAALLAALSFLALGRQAPVQGPAVRVSTAIADVHLEPNEASAMVARQFYGAVLGLRGAEGSWDRVGVQLGGQSMIVEGYVAREMVTEGAAAGPWRASPEAARASRAAWTDISVGVDAGGSTRWLAPMWTRVVPIVDRATTVEGIAATGAVETAASGGAVLPADAAGEVSWTWLTPRGSPHAALDSRTPALTVLYTQAPGLVRSEFVPNLVKLVPAGPAWSIVSVARGRSDAATRDQRWAVGAALKQRQIGAEINASGPGMMTVNVRTPLSPGDYAVVLRPAYATPYSSSNILGGGVEGVVFGAVWAFTVR